MMTSIPRAGLAGVLAACALALSARAETTPDNPTAYTALRVLSKTLGREALDRVVEVTGHDGAPQPASWKIVLKDGEGSREVEVEDGKITAQRPLSRPPAYSTPIKLADLNLDSSGAFDATDAQARKVKLRFDSLNYALWVNESTGKPVWHIELLSKEGTGVGAIRVAAHDGTVISMDGRLASNPPPAVVSSTPRPLVPATPRPVVVTTPRPVVVSTPPPTPRVVYSTPRPVTTTTTTTTVERNPTVVTESDNVYGQPQPPPQPPPVEEEGGLFTRTGRSLDHTGQRVEGTLRRAGAKVQRFFTGHSDLDRNATPEPETADNRPD